VTAAALVDPLAPLAAAAAAGNTEAEGALYAAVEKLLARKVASLVASRPRLRVHVEDLCQEAAVVAVEAARRFEEDRGAKVSTYIAGSVGFALLRVSRDLAAAAGVRLPAHVADENDRHVARARRPVASLDAAIGNGEDGMTLGDLLAARDAGVDLDVKMDLAAAVAALPAREAAVIARRFGLDGRPTEQLDAIGADLGVSRETVRHVESRALVRLRRSLLESEEASSTSTSSGYRAPSGDTSSSS